MLNSTVSNNSAYSNGGGIYNSATVTAFFCTIAGNLADSYAALAETLSRVGKSEDALQMAEQALLHKPWVAAQHLNSVGIAYDLAGKPEEAIAPLKQFLSHYPNILGAHLTLAAVYSELGKETEAHTEAAEVLRLNPQFSLEVHKERVPIKDPAMLERHLAALRKAGWVVTSATRSPSI